MSKTQVEEELRRKLSLTLTANYPGTTATEQFLDDCMMLMGESHKDFPTQVTHVEKLSAKATGPEE